MSQTPHPRAQLSAYLDGALSPAERSAVDAHLASCDDCRARLAELRATAHVIAALPSPVPSRRLAPRIATVPAWLAPLRTLSTIASAVSVFLFIASALLANIGTLATASASAASQPLLAPGGQAAAPAPAAASTPAAAFRNAGGASAPTAAASAAAAQDAAKSFASASPSPSGIATGFVISTAEGHGVVYYSTPFASPWLWLALAVLTGAVAILLQRRLRAA